MRHRPMRKRAKWLLASLAAVLAVSGGGWAVMDRPQRDADERGRHAAGGLPPATAAVERGDLSSGLQVEGTLGYARERKLNAAGPGVLTWTADTGSAVERDGKLYEVNGRATWLMYGSTPMYRPLKAGDKGEDVKQLKRNLQASGTGPGSTRRTAPSPRVRPRRSSGGRRRTRRRRRARSARRTSPSPRGRSGCGRATRRSVTNWRRASRC